MMMQRFWRHVTSEQLADHLEDYLNHLNIVHMVGIFLTKDGSGP